MSSGFQMISTAMVMFLFSCILGHEAWAHNRGKLIIAETIYANARDTPEGLIVGSDSDWTSTITGTSAVSWLNATNYIEW